MSEPGEYKMPFGKHRGEKLSDIPIGYLDWLLGIDLQPETRTAIEAYLATQAEYDQEPKDWKEGREDVEDWRTM